MATSRMASGYVDVDQARIYYETAGSGIPVVLIHAGVSDSQQWNNEFANLSQDFQVTRYDLRGYGKSDPVEGPFSHLEDLTKLVDAREIRPPMILMGCSLGGALSLDYAIHEPGKIKALIIVGPGMCGLELDISEPEAFSAAKKAFEEGDLSLLAEIETQIWFDSMDQKPDKIDCSMRALLYEMQRSVVGQEVQRMGFRHGETNQDCSEHLKELDFPVLIIVGSNDLPYMHAVADYMVDNMPFAQKEIIEDAAHLPNLDQPGEFQELVEDFLFGLVIG